MTSTTTSPRRAAVLGSPIAHSLSPVLHTTAYRVLGLAWSYEAIECDEDQLPDLLESLDETYVGLSLTMPLKRAVIPLLDEVSDLARAVGAANTVLFGGLGPFAHRRGENTDVPGLVAAVRQLRPDGVGSGAVLGAGATAAAAIAAVRELGVARAQVVVRDRARVTGLQAAADRLGVDVDIVDWPALGALADAELVISTVPAGATDALAAAESAPVGAGQLLFDVLYDPWPTPFAAAALAAGAQVIGGLELLVQQAALQVELMTGRPAPVEAMRTAGQAAILSR
ncbi:MAG: shikimate dehydrogenase [Actinomycetota bacterium]|nr:shikimate dehydrogenase [Actinomycetota bacterium]